MLKNTAKDIAGFPAGLLLYNKHKRLVLLAHEKTNKYACKGSVRQSQKTSWSMAWGSRKQGETDFLQTAMREHAEEIGTQLPSMAEIRRRAKVVKRRGNGKGVVYLLEVSDQEAEEIHCNPSPTDTKTLEVSWKCIDKVMQFDWVRFETYTMLNDDVMKLMEDIEEDSVSGDDVAVATKPRSIPNKKRLKQRQRHVVRDSSSSDDEDDDSDDASMATQPPAAKRTRPNVVDWYTRVGKGEELTVVENINLQAVDIFQSLEPLSGCSRAYAVTMMHEKKAVQGGHGTKSSPR